MRVGIETRLNLTIPQQYTAEHLQDVLRVVKPEWEVDKIRYKDLSENGYININVACYTGDHLDENAVVIRLFEPEMLKNFQKDIIDGIHLANWASFSPEILCWFENGVCMRFMPGDTFTWKTTSLLYKPEITGAISHEIAKLHSAILLERAKAMDVTEKFAGLDPVWTGARWRLLVNNPDVPKTFLDSVPAQDAIYREIEELETLLGRLNSPRRFCHMDINPTNIIYNEKQDRAVIVDYENLCIYFAACEIAWYFLTFFDITEPDYVASYPNEFYRRKFIRQYLDHMRRNEQLDGQASEEEIELFMHHVEVGFMLMLLRTVIIGYVLLSYTPPHSTIEMATSLVVESWNMYQAHKRSVLAKVADEQRWKYNFTTFR